MEEMTFVTFAAPYIAGFVLPPVFDAGSPPHLTPGPRFFPYMTVYLTIGPKNRKGLQAEACNPLILLARLERFELPAF